MADYKQTTDCIVNYLKSQTGSPYKNMNASYLIASILLYCDYKHYGPETLLQDSLDILENVMNENKKDFVESEDSVSL